jgi:hypothetical protein
MSNSGYPYTSVTGVKGTCKYTKSSGKVTTAPTAYKNVTNAAYATIAQMQSAVAIKPNSVGI